MSQHVLPSWNNGQARQRILSFVDDVVRHVPREQRVAVFDNDGTLWVEKPMPIQLDFILRRLHEMAEADSSLRDKHPWKAAYERDYAWLGKVMEDHYNGDDSDLGTLLAGVLAAHGGLSVDEFEQLANEFLHLAQHPTLGRGYAECAYVPMVELLRYLEANGFANYIASGGGRDFMRPVTEEMYGIPRERVIGSSTALEYVAGGGGGKIMRKPELDVVDDGPAKPVRIWSTVGRPPLIAAGNSNGDIPMLRFAGTSSQRGLRILVLHDDAQREFDYVTGAEKAIDAARQEDWTVLSIKNDWATVFASAMSP